MRICQPISRFAASTSVVAISAAAWASPAFAQTNAQQQDAQRNNVAVDCSTLTDAAQRATCLQTQGQNAPASAGAPAAKTRCADAGNVTVRFASSTNAD